MQGWFSPQHQAPVSLGPSFLRTNSSPFPEVLNLSPRATRTKKYGPNKKGEWRAAVNPSQLFFTSTFAKLKLQIYQSGSIRLIRFLGPALQIGKSA